MSEYLKTKQIEKDTSENDNSTKEKPEKYSSGKEHTDNKTFMERRTLNKLQI